MSPEILPSSAVSHPAEEKTGLPVRARPAKKRSKKDILYKKRRPHRAGRPPKINNDTVKKLEAAFTNDFTLEEAWDYAGISKQTYYNWIKKSPVFVDRMRRAQNYPLTLAKRSMITQIKGDPHEPLSGDGQLALRFLERRQPDRYRTKIEGDPLTLPNVTVIVPGDKAHPRFRPQKKK